MSFLVGYARIAPNEPDDSEGALRAFFASHNVEAKRVFVERTHWVSDRPWLSSALECLDSGATLLVPNLYRLTNSARSMVLILTRIQSSGAQLRIDSEGIDTGTERGRHFRTDIGILAGVEASFMRERQKNGVEAAKLSGAYKGRAPTALQQMEEIWRLRDEGLTFAKIGAALGISDASAYQINKRRAELQKQPTQDSAIQQPED